MKKDNHRKTRKFLVFFVFVTLIVAIVAVGATIALTKQEVRTVKQAEVTTKDIALTKDASLAQYLLDSVVIDSSSMQFASIDFNGDDEGGDYTVALYNFKVDGGHGGGFRVYDHFGRLKYEDNSSVWSSNPTTWRWVKTGDFDFDGSDELFISGTEEGTGAYTHQIVFDVSRFGLQKLSDTVFDEIPAGTSVVIGKKYEDVERGIRLSLPSGWAAGTDIEDGDFYVYGQLPHTTVLFDIFTDNLSWKRAEESSAEIAANDVLVKEEMLTVGGFPTTMRLYQRSTGADSFFQYGEYFVDGGSRWYLITTSDPSDDISSIIRSIEFTK